LTGSNFCIFVENDVETVYEIFGKWIKALSRATELAAEKEATKTGNDYREPEKNEFVVCKKGHIIKIRA
jgi:hypothetical protein